jgi:IclR family acetate operon transcriptional repressor
MVAEPSTRTVERALALLATVCDRDGANLADTARSCDLAPSTALRLLRTLETSGFVRKDELGVYRPGTRIIQLGAQALSNESLIDLGKAAMEELATDAGESVYLSVEGHAATALYIAIVEGTHSVRHASWVGPYRWRPPRPDTRSAARFPTTGMSSSSAASRPTSRRSPAPCTPRPG